MRWLFDLFLPRREPVLSDATVHDAPAMARLHAASFRRGWSEDEIERLLLERNVHAHRALIGRRLVGFIMSRIAADEAEILSVAVAPEERGRAIAGRLLRLHLGRLAALGVRTVFLEVEDGNIPALRLYRGFKEVGRREGYYSKDSAAPARALVLRRDLV